MVLIPHAQEDAAASVSGLAEGLGGLREPENLAHHWAEALRFDQFGDPAQGVRPRPTGASRPDAFGLAGILGQAASHGDIDPARSQHFERAFRELASHGVYDHIQIVDGLFERPGVVVDSRFGAERVDEIEVGGRGRADDVRTLPARQLDDIVADAARGAVDKYALASLHISDIEGGTPGRQRADRDRRCLLGAEARWLGLDIALLRQPIFGVGAREGSVDLLARLE